VSAMRIALAIVLKTACNFAAIIHWNYIGALL
jgi:hypothetical protein